STVQHPPDRKPGKYGGRKRSSHFGIIRGGNSNIIHPLNIFSQKHAQKMVEKDVQGADQPSSPKRIFLTSLSQRATMLSQTGHFPINRPPSKKEEKDSKKILWNTRYKIKG
ncbi:MAG: hypothetical protein QW575_04975, partial [Thermoproteota archaeon]